MTGHNTVYLGSKLIDQRRLPTRKVAGGFRVHCCACAGWCVRFLWQLIFQGFILVCTYKISLLRLQAAPFLEEPGIEAEFASFDLKRFFKLALIVQTIGSSAMSLKKMQASNKQITLPSWLSEEDISYLASVYAKTGFAGGINYYRCLDLNWELMAPWTRAKVQVPTKFIVGDGDLAYHHPGVKSYIHKGGLKRDVPMLEEVVVIRGAGHFIQQERAQEISHHIYDYIKKFHTGGSTPKLSKL